MHKRTMWFWRRRLGPWLVTGMWWRQRIFFGITAVVGEEWEISERDLKGV